MPAVGLAVPDVHAEGALDLIEPLRALGPAHLVCAFDARQGHDAGLAQTYGELARALRAELVVEVVLPCVDLEGKPTDDLGVLRRDLNYVKGQIERVAVRPDRIAVSPAVDLKCTLPGSIWPKAPTWPELMAAARAAFPGIPVGGGMFSYFTELNRKRPPAELLDFICHTTCPLVHAGDDLSLTEGLEALPYIFQTARSFAGGKPYWLFPTAIAMRQNPYGAAPAENPAGGRVAMARTDPREHALIGAAWYAGYLGHAARAGLEAVRGRPSPGHRVSSHLPGWRRATMCCVAMPPCATPLCWHPAAVPHVTCRCWPRARPPACSCGSSTLPTGRSGFACKPPSRCCTMPPSSWSARLASSS